MGTYLPRGVKPLLLVGRGGPLLDTIEAELGKSFEVPLVLVESGRVAVKKKLNRLIRATGFWRLPMLPLDVLLLVLFHRAFARKVLMFQSLARRENSHSARRGERLLFSDVRKLRLPAGFAREAFAGTLVFGTSIIPPEVLKRLPDPIVNFHGGMVPKYRNVHGDFWATAWRDTEHWGTSFLLVAEGIDDGAVVYQEANHLKFSRSVSTNASRNFFFGLSRMNQVMKTCLENPPYVGGATSATHAAELNQTPRACDWLRFGIFP